MDAQAISTTSGKRYSGPWLRMAIPATFGIKITAEFDYGPKQPHCYDGTYGRVSEEQLYMPKMSDWIIKTAPAGADMSWRY